MTEIPKGFMVLALISGIGAFPMALYSVDAAAVLVIIGVTFWWLGLFQRNKKW